MDRPLRQPDLLRTSRAIGLIHRYLRWRNTRATDPVEPSRPWDDETDMIAQVNDSISGLAGGTRTRDLARAHRISRATQDRNRLS